MIEGIDHCGKTTQAKLLADALAQQVPAVPVRSMHFPDRDTEIGKMINSYLQSSSHLEDHAVHLLFSANRWEKRVEILSALYAGDTIICDRYAHSGAAFSSAKADLDMEFCIAPDKGLPKPDLVVFLDINPEAAATRSDYGKERYETLAFQMRVADQFAAVQKLDENCGRWCVVDATKSIEDVHVQILGEVQRTMQYVFSPDVGMLWTKPQKFDDFFRNEDSVYCARLTREGATKLVAYSSTDTDALDAKLSEVPSSPPQVANKRVMNLSRRMSSSLDYADFYNPPERFKKTIRF